jgi:hypothetical protein
MNDSSAEVYEVSRILPTQTNTRQYRVRRISDGQERAVSEAQLVSVESQNMLERPEIEAQQEQQRVRNARASARSQALSRRDQQKRC